MLNWLLDNMTELVIGVMVTICILGGGCLLYLSYQLGTF